MHIDIPVSENPDIKIHITWNNTKNNIVLRGYPIDAKSGLRVKGFNTIKRTARNQDGIIFAQSYIVSTIVKMMSPQKQAKRGESRIIKYELDNNSPIVQSFFELLEKGIQIRKWHESTQHNALVYFRNNVLPLIQHVYNPQDFTPEDYENLKNMLIEKNISHGRSKKNLQNAAKGTRDHLFEAAAIYEAMCELNPSLPDISLFSEARMERIANEQVKTLSFEILKNFRSEVEGIVDSNPQLARAAAIYESCGTRPAEAAGVTRNAILDREDYVAVDILFQARKGNLTKVLKSTAGYRRIVADDWGAFIIRCCNYLIGENERTDIPPCSEDKLANWVKEALIRSGCTESYFAKVGRQIEKDTEQDLNSSVNMQTTSYIVRRSRLNIWKNICGYTSDEIDYFSGHKMAQRQSAKINIHDPELLKLMAVKNSRFDLNPEVSNHPRISPLPLVPGTELLVYEFDRFKIENKTDATVHAKVVIKTAEPGEIITLTTNGSIKDYSHSVSYNTNRIRPNTEIIGVLGDEEDRN